VHSNTFSLTLKLSEVQRPAEMDMVTYKSVRITTHNLMQRFKKDAVTLLLMDETLHNPSVKE
jgi:hypothetical protein